MDIMIRGFSSGDVEIRIYKTSSRTVPYQIKYRDGAKIAGFDTLEKAEMYLQGYIKGYDKGHTDGYNLANLWKEKREKGGTNE